jgi:SAM-dependent methyltransferase
MALIGKPLVEPEYARSTRAAFNIVAVDHTRLLSPELATKPLDRALLTAFAELVRAAGGRPVADLGCGPGRVTAYLHSLGLATFGVDLSPAMVAVARQAYPALRFDERSMSALDLSDGILGGIVAWYSIIHLPPELLSATFAEFHRVLVPGGTVLLAFQVGAERVRLTEAHGHAISLDAYRLAPDRVVEFLTQAGFRVRAQVIREPEKFEKVPQAYLLAGKAP